MSIAKTLYDRMDSIRTKVLGRITYKAEIRNIERKKSLWSSVKITPKKESEIHDYWKNLTGIDIDSRWHRLYSSYLGGDVLVDYFPEVLYSTKLENKLSNLKFNGILNDKGFIISIFPGNDEYRNPEVVVYNSYGIYSDCHKSIISEEEARKRIGDCGTVIVKPTIDTSSGEGVLKVKFENGIDKKSGITVTQLIKQYKQNFIVQECVKQSDYLSNLCDKSLNTFRVITYICDGKVFNAPLSLRMGTGTSFLDNIHAGGIGIGITCDYKCRKYAFSEMGEKYEVHPYSNVMFEGYDITPLGAVVKVAKELHGRVPMLKMISWDWSLDENNKPVLIELNITGQSVWFPQMLNGESFFGDQTEYFASMIKEK